MRTLERNEKIIYHSKRRLTDEGVEYFDPPVALKANPMPVSNQWLTNGKGTFELGIKRFILSRDMLRDTIVFNPYGYEHPIEGESSYGISEEFPYGWVDEYLTRWANDLLHGDRFWVDITPPDDYIMAQEADYMVIGVEPSPNYIAVILKRLAV